MCKISILTATYNRRHTLGKVYQSLLAQTCKGFEWVISDDGSTDNTEELVRSWQKLDNGFDIIYSKLPHVGFPRALNNGVNHSRTPWTMMLDSDDYLLPQTIEALLPWLDEIEGTEKMAGIGVTRTHSDGSFMKNQKPLINPELGYVDATNSDRAKYGLDLDCFEVIRTSLLKEYPFQYWPTEEYAPPALNYNAMSLNGWKIRWRTGHFYICEYQPDGLTKSNIKVKKNPMGYAMMFNQNLLRFPDFKSRCSNAIQMTALCIAAGHWTYLLKSNALLVTTLTLPIGIVWGIRRKLQFAKM